jgi:hypothetical protein
VEIDPTYSVYIIVVPDDEAPDLLIGMEADALVESGLDHKEATDLMQDVWIKA